MKKLAFLAVIVLALLASCSNGGDGQLVGVKDRPTTQDFNPYGMIYLSDGTFRMGAGGEDVVYGNTNQAKTVSIQSFWIDQTEITNNEYRQFVYWVRDSLAHALLGAAELSENAKDMHYQSYTSGENEGELIEPRLINWNAKIPWDSQDEEVQAALSPLTMKVNTRFYHYSSSRANVAMYNFEFWWFDYRNYVDPKDPESFGASYKEFDKEGYEYGGLFANRPSSVQGFEKFMKHDVVNIYPDTLCWAHDFTNSDNEAMLMSYFNLSKYDHYPVVGINWSQARAFSYWRTHLRNCWLQSKGYEFENEFKLPSEAEWEYAARGGQALAPYPWGDGVTNRAGCYLANFKPRRGDYMADGFISPGIVAHYHANDYGIYDMAGNVAEWCNDAYDNSATNFTHDLNSSYTYYAKKDDHVTKKKKVIRGGSWKDVAYYNTVYARTYEYQDTTKCYIGFRCVQKHSGPMRTSGNGPASHIY